MIAPTQLPITWRNYTAALDIDQISELERLDDLPNPEYTWDRHRTGMIAIALGMAEDNREYRKWRRTYRLRHALGMAG